MTGDGRGFRPGMGFFGSGVTAGNVGAVSGTVFGGVEVIADIGTTTAGGGGRLTTGDGVVGLDGEAGEFVLGVTSGTSAAVKTLPPFIRLWSMGVVKSTFVSSSRKMTRRFGTSVGKNP